MTPDVSIIIPCYNNERYIAQAIESALNQTYSAVEVIVVNDGSTDKSAEAIAPYTDEITYIEIENHGACHARNIGWCRATGSYIKFLDSDDTLYLDAIEKQVAQSEELDDNHHVVFGDARYVNEQGELSHETDFASYPANENRILYILKRNLQTSLPLHRRSWLERVNGFDETLSRAQEYDLHFRLSAVGIQFVHCPVKVVRVLEHEGTDRISNQDHFVNDPEGRLRRIRERANAARSQELLDDALRRHLARDAWHGGRKAIRADFNAIANKYFELARFLHQDHMASSSSIYRGLVRLTNPQIAERVVGWGKRR